MSISRYMIQVQYTKFLFLHSQNWKVNYKTTYRSTKYQFLHGAIASHAQPSSFGNILNLIFGITCPLENHWM